MYNANLKPFLILRKKKVKLCPGARGGDKKPFIPQSQRIISHQGPNFVRTSCSGPGSRFPHSVQNHLIDTGALLTSSSSCWCIGPAAVAVVRTQSRPAAAFAVAQVQWRPLVVTVAKSQLDIAAVVGPPAAAAVVAVVKILFKSHK